MFPYCQRPTHPLSGGSGAKGIQVDQVRARFEAYCAPVPESGCWLWMGPARNRKGYGAIDVHGVRLQAHRLSYVLHKGPVPKHKLVCHKCDTPLCVNPDHLFLGTNADNMRDAMAKGRLHIPEASVRVALDAEQLKALRHDAETMSQRALCAKYGIGKGTVHRALHGVGPYAEPQP